MTASQAIPSPHGDVVLVEYDLAGEPSTVVTREGRACRAWTFIEDVRGDATYATPERLGARVPLPRYIDGGPPQRVWHVDGLPLAVEGGADAPTPGGYAALGLVRVPEPLGDDPFEGALPVEEGALEYCYACDGYVHGGRLCRHLRWGDDGLVGPGADGDLARAEEPPRSFAWVVRAVGCARALRRALRGDGRVAADVRSPLVGRDSVDLTIGGAAFSRAANRLHDAAAPGDVDLREGICWLLGLDERTAAANRLALAWLDREVAAQDARRASGERCYGVRSGGWGGGEVTTRGLTWAEALAMLRSLPAAERGRANRDRAVAVRLVPKRGPGEEPR